MRLLIVLIWVLHIFVHIHDSKKQVESIIHDSRNDKAYTSTHTYTVAVSSAEFTKVTGSPQEVWSKGCRHLSSHMPLLWNIHNQGVFENDHIRMANSPDMIFHTENVWYIFMSFSISLTWNVELPFGSPENSVTKDTEGSLYRGWRSSTQLAQVEVLAGGSLFSCPSTFN